MIWPPVFAPSEKQYTHVCICISLYLYIPKTLPVLLGTNWVYSSLQEIPRQPFVTVVSFISTSPCDFYISELTIAKGYNYSKKSLKMEGNTSGKFKRICVFCGSNYGHREVFRIAAAELGNELVGLFVFLRLPSLSFNLCFAAHAL